MTAPLVVVLDGIGLLAVLLLSGLAARAERQSFDDYGLPLRQAFQNKFWKGYFRRTWRLRAFSFQREAESKESMSS